MSEPQEQPNNEVLAVKLDYIQRDISVIKADLKDIKNDAIGRREYAEKIKDIDTAVSGLSTDVEILKEYRWKLAGIVAVATFLSSSAGIIILKYIIK